MQTCEKCGGTYPKQQRDGGLYIHTCPPPREETAPAPAAPKEAAAPKTPKRK